MKNILVIAAHPDDDILGCGATLHKYAKLGAEIRVVFIAEGTTCRYEDSSCNTAKQQLLQRTQNGVDALKRIGVKSWKFYDLPCGCLDMEPQLKINRIIENEIQISHPDCIFTHWKGDANLDHRKVYDSVIIATRPIGNSIVKAVYCFEVLSSTEWSFSEAFTPNHYVVLSEENITAKIDAMNEYASEIGEYPHPRSAEIIRSKSMVRGAEVGCSLAECFYLVREILE